MSQDDDLYATLKVAREADESTVKKAYLKLARETHPARCPGDEDANARFQAIGRAYAILRDPEKRKVYDSTGIVDDDSADFKTMYDFWRDVRGPPRKKSRCRRRPTFNRFA